MHIKELGFLFRVYTPIGMTWNCFAHKACACASEATRNVTVRSIESAGTPLLGSASAYTYPYLCLSVGVRVVLYVEME